MGKKVKSNFWRFYKVLLVILLAVVATTWLIFYLFLDSYEKGIPTHTVENVISWMEDKNVGRLVNYINVQDERINNKENIKSILKTKLDNGKYEYVVNQKENTDANPVYNILKDNEVVAKVTLKLSNKKGLFKTKVWHITSIDEILGSANTIKIVVPASSTVKVNTVTLSEDNIVDKESYPSFLENIKDYASIKLMTTYELNNIYGEPFITVSSDGKDAILESENYEYVYPFASDDDVKNEVESRVKDFVINYTRYVECERQFGSVTPYLVSGSKAYDFLQAIQKTNIWVSNHTATVFSDIEISNVKKYSKDAISLEAKYSYNFKANGNERNFDSNLTIYMVKRNGTWLVADMTT